MKTYKLMILAVITTITCLQSGLNSQEHTAYAPYYLGGYGYFAWGFNNGAGKVTVHVTGNDSGAEPSSDLGSLVSWCVYMADFYDGYYAYGDGYELFESGAP